jgi:hypothetical protein
MRSTRLLVALALSLAGTAALHATTPAGRTVQALMDGWVDPSADALWGAVGEVQTKDGRHIRAPRRDDAWRRLRVRADRLVAGARALGLARSAGGEGHGALADASTPGIRTAAQITADIRADPGRFAAAARRLERAGLDAASAIDRKDPRALTTAGATIDAACEACHAAYWYPRTPPAALPPDEDFARLATTP